MDQFYRNNEGICKNLTYRKILSTKNEQLTKHIKLTEYKTKIILTIAGFI